MVRHIRFHGRGGQGMKLASRIVSRAAFLEGYEVQDSPVYGAERRGAPVVAFARYGREPIRERGYVYAPDAVVVADASLLDQPQAAVLDGVDEHALVLVNTTHAAADLIARYGIRGPTWVCDITGLALEVLGHALLSAPIAGLVVRSVGLCDSVRLAAAVRAELGEVGLSAADLARNLDATQRVFESTEPVGLALRPPAGPPAATTPFVIPHLPARVSVPSIAREATSELRHTEGWRVFRPEIDLSGCTRCFLCFALCPEGAIHLDDDHFPHVDYAHCKGCLVCVHECPPGVIRSVREEAREEAAT